MTPQQAQERAMAVWSEVDDISTPNGTQADIIAAALLSVHNETVERCAEVAGGGLRAPGKTVITVAAATAYNQGRQEAAAQIRALVETKP
jgi:hypothetical protein